MPEKSETNPETGGSNQILHAWGCETKTEKRQNAPKQIVPGGKTNDLLPEWMSVPEALHLTPERESIRSLGRGG